MTAAMIFHAETMNQLQGTVKIRMASVNPEHIGQMANVLADIIAHHTIVSSDETRGIQELTSMMITRNNLK